MEVIKEVKLYVMNPNGELEKLTGSTYFRQKKDTTWETVDLEKLAKMTVAKSIIKRFCTELEKELIKQLDPDSVTLKSDDTVTDTKTIEKVLDSICVAKGWYV